MGKKKEELIYDYEGNPDVEAMREQRGEPTKFKAPGEDQKWRARNIITIHWQLLGIECPYPSFVYVMACVIDHANPTTGRCDASQAVMAIETGYHRDTVRKVLRWAAKNTPSLKMELRERRRHGQFKSYAYHLQWDAFELFWIAAAEDIEIQKAALRSTENHPCRLKGQHGDVESRVNTAMPTPGLNTNHKEGTAKTEPHPERAHAQARDAMPVIEEEKRGIQKEEFVSDSESQQQPPAKPLDMGWWWRKLAEKEAELARAKTPEHREAWAAEIERFKIRMQEVEDGQRRTAAPCKG